jgi:hypothetical protein
MYLTIIFKLLSCFSIKRRLFRSVNNNYLICMSTGNFSEDHLIAVFDIHLSEYTWPLDNIMRIMITHILCLVTGNQHFLEADRNCNQSNVPCKRGLEPLPAFEVKYIFNESIIKWLLTLC